MLKIEELVPKKEWILLAEDDEPLSSVRYYNGKFGWMDKNGGYWFSSLDLAVKARSSKTQ